jgi:hypothetical protein
VAQTRARGTQPVRDIAAAATLTAEGPTPRRRGTRDGRGSSLQRAALRPIAQVWPVSQRGASEALAGQRTPAQASEYPTAAGRCLRLSGTRPAAAGRLHADAYMQTPEKRSQVRPASSHSLFVVYDRGEAPGYEVSYDSRVAIPVTYSRHGGAAHLDRLEGHGVTLRHGASSRRRSRWSPDGVRDEARGDLRACFDRRRHVVRPLRRPQDGIETAAAGRVPLLSAPAAAVLEPPLSALSADHRRGPRHPVAKPSRCGS